MRDAADEWDERYRQGRTMPDEPAGLLVENLPLLPKGGKALDIAMGTGRNALYLASLGFRVTGIDLSTVAVEKCRKKAERLGLSVEALVADLERSPLPSNDYDLIVNFYYLQRSLAPQIVASLKPGGVLVFESFTVDQLQFGWGPKSSEHLLHPGELREMFPDLETLLYHEGTVQGDRGPKAVASLIARKRA
ncbi:MAG: methyltransferase domain-containing protein [Dehalococcoidia bacterium]|nr:MAG: methyltransferase domain-containing protein [Dehalococcoidia bacterium]